MTPSKTAKRQVKVYGPKEFTENGFKCRIKAFVRWDDQCGNGQNSFAITGETDVWEGRSWRQYGGGCIHELIAEHFPELEPYIKWHLMFADGPMHYIANTQYHAGNRDCYGLRKGERRQIVDGKSGLPSWKLVADTLLPPYKDAAECPTETTTLRYVPWDRVGNGKDRDLDAARRCAVWPEATDWELTAPFLESRLRDRLPALMEEFKTAVESLGLEW